MIRQKQTRMVAWTIRVFCSLYGNSDLPAGRSSSLDRDANFFTNAMAGHSADEVELRAMDLLRRTYDVDLRDRRDVDRENFLDSYTGHVRSHSKSSAGFGAVLSRDNQTLERSSSLEDFDFRSRFQFFECLFVYHCDSYYAAPLPWFAIAVSIFTRSSTEVRTLT